LPPVPAADTIVLMRDFLLYSQWPHIAVGICLALALVSSGAPRPAWAHSLAFSKWVRHFLALAVFADITILVMRMLAMHSL